MRGWALGGTAVLMVAGASVANAGMTGHMAAHMIAVAVAAPMLAYGLQDTSLDPAARWPRLVTPLAMSVAELVVVWAWHLPAARRAADHAAWASAAEQGCFLLVGMLLWSAVLGRAPEARASGAGALLLTSMHMTLLGALIGLAPRPLYPAMTHGGPGGLSALEDQQLSGVVMLLVGGAAYLAGGLWNLRGLLRERGEAA